jgi:hypothetical protein
LTRLAAVVTAALILTAGCSGRPANSPLPQSIGEDPDSAPDDLVRIIACFHAHGLPNYPGAQYDPSDGRWHFPNNQPPLTTAMRQACASLMPQATPASPIPTAQLADLLQYATCVRAHGPPDWPDPAVDGVFHTAIDPKADPAARSAMDACERYLASSGGKLYLGQPDD